MTNKEFKNYVKLRDIMFESLAKLLNTPIINIINYVIEQDIIQVIYVDGCMLNKITVSKEALLKGKPIQRQVSQSIFTNCCWEPGEDYYEEGMIE